MTDKAKRLTVSYAEVDAPDGQLYRVAVLVEGEPTVYSLEGPSKAVVMSKLARLLVWLV